MPCRVGIHSVLPVPSSSCPLACLPYPPGPPGGGLAPWQMQPPTLFRVSVVKIIDGPLKIFPLSKFSQSQNLKISPSQNFPHPKISPYQNLTHHKSPKISPEWKSRSPNNLLTTA